MSDLGNVLSTIFGGLGGLLLSKRENGGRVRKGKPYLVGEAGKEIIVPDSDGTVFPLYKLSGKTEEKLHENKKSKKVSNWLSGKGLELSFDASEDSKSTAVIDKLFLNEKKKKEKKDVNIINKLGLDKMDLKF
jgi:SLT domain-containing protein